MSDPLEQSGRGSVQSSDISNLKFVKLHSPKMKSVYWQHFGFPTNEHDRIITKQNVVCTLCHKVLTNHGNTTNLRAHLQHRHKDIFQKICIENGIRVPPRRPFTKPTSSGRHSSINSSNKRDPLRQKIKVELQDPTPELLNQGSLPADEPSMLYETMVPMTYDDDDVIDADHFAKVEVSGGNGGPSGISQTKNSGQSNMEVITVESKSGIVANFRTDIGEYDPYQLQESLVNMVVQDIRNIDTLYDAGMSNFIRTLSGSIVLPSEKKIEALIGELHSDKLTTLANQIKMRSQIKPFSLGFEIWKNVESKHFLSIYYNYTTDAPDYNLLNQFYCTVEYNKFTSIDGIFEEFNLENCTAAIVSYDYDDYLKHFLRNRNIPIILSCDTTVDKCLRCVFALPEVSTIIEQVREVIMRYATEISLKDVEIPTLNDDFPWTYYEVLKFFAETVSWPEDLDILVTSAKAITDTLYALVIYLDTLKGEEIPHSSMLSPITAKIVKKLSLSETDDEFVVTLKSTICRELQDLVIADDHLTIAALLDPRFHRLTTVNNFGNCLQILSQKYNRIREQEGCTPMLAKQSKLEPSTSANAKKSNLELFFDIQDEQAAVSMTHDESNVENDIKRYRTEVYANLDESPFSWWNKMGHLYISLKQLAPIYQCVPCVVNMNFKKPVKEQIYTQQKRYMLTGNLIDAILFLHNDNKINY